MLENKNIGLSEYKPVIVKILHSYMFTLLHYVQVFKVEVQTVIFFSFNYFVYYIFHFHVHSLAHNVARCIRSGMNPWWKKIPGNRK